MSEAVHPVVKRGPGRCAWCHDEVAIEERAACAACLAVHHGDCWRREGRCAACGEKAVLATASALPADPVVAAIGRELILAGGRDARQAVRRTMPHLAKRRRIAAALAGAMVSVALAAGLNQRPLGAIVALIGLALAVTIQFVWVLLPARRELRRLQEQIRESEAPRPRRAVQTKEAAP